MAEIDDIVNRLRTFDGTAMSVPFSEIDMDRFVGKGGVVESDNIMSIHDFLATYCVVENKIPRVRKRYVQYFLAMRAFIAQFKVIGPIRRSFFSIPYMKIMYMYGEQKEEDLEEEKEIEIPEVEINEDFLDCYGDNNMYYDSTISNAYFDKIKKEFTKIELIRKYRHYLTMKNLSVSVGLMKYDNPLEFVSTFDKQFGLYYEVVYKLQKKKGERLKIFIPHDGLGALSMICSVLGVEYRSYEPYGIGEIAYRLGIITSKSVFDVKPRDDEVVILANLDDYLGDNIQLYNKYENVVITENRLYTGCNPKNMLVSTHGRVHTDLLDDDFITGGGVISKSVPMIQKYNNVPLGTKAEAFLLLNGLPVYNDGHVQTKTKSVVTKEKIRYIVTTDKVKDLQTLTYVLTSPPILNIVNRNEPTRYDVGKLGEVKVYKDQYFTVTGEKAEVCGFDFFETVKIRRYDHNHELKGWYKEKFFIVGKCKNPRSKRYIVEYGKKEYIVYLSSVTSTKGIVYHFFQYRVDVQMYSRVVDQVIDQVIDEG